MTGPRDDDSIRAAAYAAGALSPEERREVEADARRSPGLAAELREFGETAAVLGLAVPPVTPDAALRDKLFAALDETPQGATVTRGPWTRRLVGVVVASAAAVIVGVLAVGTLVLPQFAPVSDVDRIVAAADADRATADVEAGGTVTAVWSASLDRAAILVEGLAELPSDETYQLWLIRDGEPLPSETFSSRDGDLVSVVLAGEMEPGDAIGITVEPAGGSEVPSAAPIVVVPTA